MTKGIRNLILSSYSFCVKLLYYPTVQRISHQWQCIKLSEAYNTIKKQTTTTTKYTLVLGDQRLKMAEWEEIHHSRNLKTQSSYFIARIRFSSPSLYQIYQTSNVLWIPYCPSVESKQSRKSASFSLKQRLWTAVTMYNCQQKHLGYRLLQFAPTRKKCL